MSHFFTTELGRMRTEEAIARADRYRLAQQAQQHKERETLSRPRRFVYRRALAAVGLSALVVAGTATAAGAYPAGPGPNTGSDIVADTFAAARESVVPETGSALPTFVEARESVVPETGSALPTFVEARESVPEGDLGSLETYAQAREGMVPEAGGDIPTFAQAREGTVPEIEVGLPTFAQARESVPGDNLGSLPTFAAAREQAVPEADLALPRRAAHVYDPAGEPVAAATFAQVREGQPAIERPAYIALSRRHNVDALDRMADGPVAVAEDEGRTRVEDSSLSMMTVAAIAALLLVLGVGVMVGIRDRNLPTPV